MTARFAIVLALTLVSAAASADEGDPRCGGLHGLWAPLPDACLANIDTDRPHQTDTPHVVPAGHVQFESAIAEVALGGSLTGAGDKNARLVLFDDNYKFGLVSGVDLQLFFAHAAYEPARSKLLPPGPFAVRAKVSIVQEHGWVPAITLLPWAFIPVAPSQVFRAGPYVFWGWELGEHFELEMNAGLLFSASPKPPVAAVLATALTYKPAKAFGTFIDIYTTGEDAALGTGLLFAVTRDVQLDAGAYVGLHGDEPLVTPFIGFSVRR